MRSNEYIIYPGAVEKLENSGLRERIDVFLKSEDHYYFGYIHYDEVPGMIKEMEQEGYFKTLPEDLADSFKGNLQGLFQEPGKYKWEVDRLGIQTFEDADYVDVALLGGFFASLILEPEEIWYYEKFGFNSINDLVGVVGALVTNSRFSFNEGLKWETEWGDGRRFVNEIKGNMHYDLLIDQNDVTPYTTKDPFGDVVSFRPKFNEDISFVGAYHSTEGPLLASLLKYHDQFDLNSTLLENDAIELLEWLSTLGAQRIGATAEHLMGTGDFEIRNYFSYFVMPLPQPDKNFCTNERTWDGVFASVEGSYTIYAGPNKELVFCYEGKENKTHKKPKVTFQASEFDDVLKGLFYQAFRGLGRTSGSALVRALDLWNSEEFKRDIIRQKKEFGI